MYNAAFHMLMRTSRHEAVVGERCIHTRTPLVGTASPYECRHGDGVAAERCRGTRRKTQDTRRKSTYLESHVNPPTQHSSVGDRASLILCEITIPYFWLPGATGLMSNPYTPNRKHPTHTPSCQHTAEGDATNAGKGCREE